MPIVGGIAQETRVTVVVLVMPAYTPGGDQVIFGCVDCGDAGLMKRRIATVNANAPAGILMPIRLVVRFMS